MGRIILDSGNFLVNFFERLVDINNSSVEEYCGIAFCRKIALCRRLVSTYLLNVDFDFSVVISFE